MQINNVEELLECCLPYHTTPQFVKLVHLIEPKGRWQFLRACKDSGSPLSKAVLASSCAADPSVFKFICDMARRPDAPRVAVTLWVAVSVEVLAGPTAEPLLLVLMPALLDGLRATKLPDTHAAAYMVTLFLVAKHQLAPDSAAALMELAARHPRREAADLSLALLAALCHFQAPAALPDAAFRCLARLPDLPAALARVGATTHAGALLRLLLPRLLDEALAAADPAADAARLREVVARAPLEPDHVALLAAGLVAALAGEAGRPRPAAAAAAALRGVLRGLGRRHPAAVDAFVTRALAPGGAPGGAEDEGEGDAGGADADEEGARKRRRRRLAVLTEAFEGTRHAPVEEGGTSLFLALEHPLPAVLPRPGSCFGGIALCITPAVYYSCCGCTMPCMTVSYAYCGCMMLCISHSA